MTRRPHPPTSHSRSPGRTRGAPPTARWTRRLGVLVLAAAIGVSAGGEPSGAAPAQTGPSGSSAVVCLDARLRPAKTCPAVTAEASIRLIDDDLVVMIENVGKATWVGGPLAVELPVPDADVEEPEGRDDSSGAAGTPEWTTRAGTVVSRCVFDPVERLRPGGRLVCRMHRFGLPDGDHDLWLTGFIGGLPRITDTIGEAPPALGVVAAATTRSIRVRLDGRRATVIAPQAAPDGATAARSGDTDGSPDGTLPALAVVGIMAAAAVGVGWWWRRRSRGIGHFPDLRQVRGVARLQEGEADEVPPADASHRGANR